MARVLIIGFGNPLRSDDGFGFRAAGRLRETVHDPDVEILSLHQLTPELMEPISRASRVIFIDAAVNGEPGEINVRPVVPGQGTASPFLHSSTPAALVAGAERLYGTRPAAILLSVTGASFELGETLSEPVQRALETCVRSRIPEMIAG